MPNGILAEPHAIQPLTLCYRRAHISRVRLCVAAAIAVFLPFYATK